MRFIIIFLILKKHRHKKHDNKNKYSSWKKYYHCTFRHCILQGALYIYEYMLNENIC